RMVELLSDLLRQSLKPGDGPEVPLREEVSFLEKYLAIEAVRFGSRLRVSMEVDGEAADALVPRLILHPLVENALYHGVARHSGPAFLHLEAHRRGETVEICVRDNGPGLLADTREGHGVGLANTRARLQLLYGSQHRFFMQADAG